MRLQDREAELASAAELGKGLAVAASEVDKANLRAAAAAAEHDRLRSRLEELEVRRPGNYSSIYFSYFGFTFTV